MSRRRFAGVFLCQTAIVLFIAISSTPAGAVPINGIDFPSGPVSFADAVFNYSPTGTRQPTQAHRNPLTALGVPDYAGDPNCTGHPCTFASLGVGGSIVLQFTDNSLTGSGDSAKDLHVFEVGPDIEHTYVDISKNGVDWFAVGKILGRTSSLDIDSFGFGPTDFFYFVRLTDDPLQGDVIAIQVGADIDSVGAITSGPPPLVTTTTTVPPTGAPEPATILLLGTGLALFRLSKSRRRS